MRQLFLIIIIATLVLCLIRPTFAPEGFESGVFPLESPLSEKFFRPAVKPQVISARQGLEKHILSKIAPKAICKVSDPDHIVLQKLERGEIDFAVVSENVLHNAIYGLLFYDGWTFRNIQFVGKLFPIRVTMLCPNTYAITDISQISKSEHIWNIDVGERFSMHHMSCMELVEFLGIRGFVRFVHHRDSDVIENYPTRIDIVYRLCTHPSPLFGLLSQRVKSHLLSTRGVNNGHIYKRMTPEEHDFYDSHSYYRKGLHDMRQLIPQTYPYLTQTNSSHVLYVPTLETSMVLVANNKVSPTVVNDYVKRLSTVKFRKWKQSPANMSHIDINIAFHPGAKHFYQDLGYTSFKKECVYYKKGHC